MWMMLTIVKKGTRDSLLNYLNSIDPNIKFTIEPPKEQGAIAFLDTFPTKLSPQFIEKLPTQIGI